MCNLQSALVIHWYSQISLDNVKTIAPLALIMEAGKIVLAQEIYKSNYQELFLEGLKKCDDILAYEKELFDISSYEIAALLFKHWNLDPIYIEILENLHTQDDLHMKEYREMIMVVNHAINPKEILTKNSVIAGCRIVKKMGLDVEHFVKACVRVKKIYMQKKQKQQEV
jgi:HD-like signal output (HDOD) protein